MQKSKIKIIFLILLQFLWTFCAKNPVRISHISVLNSNFTFIREIDDQSILNELDSIWSSRRQIAYSDDPLFPAGRFNYKLDIKTENGSERWLYDPDGYVVVLSKSIVPVFRFTDSNTIKKILIP